MNLICIILARGFWTLTPASFNQLKSNLKCGGFSPRARRSTKAQSPCLRLKGSLLEDQPSVLAILRCHLGNVISHVTSGLGQWQLASRESCRPSPHDIKDNWPEFKAFEITWSETAISVVLGCFRIVIIYIWHNIRGLYEENTNSYSETLFITDIRLTYVQVERGLAISPWDGH